MTTPRPTVARANVRRRRSMPKLRTTLDPGWQMPRWALMQRLAEVPSRQTLKRPELRSDLADNVGRFYDALWRHAHATHSATIYTTWDQLATACGYEGGSPLSALQNYAALLEEAGIIQIGGEKDHSGAWRRLRVQLLAQEWAGQLCESTPPAYPCTARRRHETRKQRKDRRRQPHRRVGGRGEATKRYRFFWGREVGSPTRLGGGVIPLAGSPPPSQPSREQTRAHATGAANHPAAFERPTAEADAEARAEARFGPAGAGAADGAAGDGRTTDAVQRACPPDRRAALVRLLVLGSSRGGPALVEAAAALPADDVVPVALAAWATRFPDREPRFSRDEADRLLRMALRWDRIGGQPSACVWLAERITGWGIGWACLDDVEDDPRTLRYFTVEFRAQVQHVWRRKTGRPDPRPNVKPRGRLL